MENGTQMPSFVSKVSKVAGKNKVLLGIAGAGLAIYAVTRFVRSSPINLNLDADESKDDSQDQHQNQAGSGKKSGGKKKKNQNHDLNNDQFMPSGLSSGAGASENQI